MNLRFNNYWESLRFPEKTSHKLQSLQNSAAKIVRRISVEGAEHPFILYRLRWLSPTKLIALYLVTAMCKSAKGIIRLPTQEMFEYLLDTQILYKRFFCW